MRRILAVLSIVVVLGAVTPAVPSSSGPSGGGAVSQVATPAGENVTTTRIAVVEFTDVYRVVDWEAGNVCYVYEHILDAGGSIDCVPIDQSRLRRPPANRTTTNGTGGNAPGG